tara:strand:+ start:84 stop:1088 length:1005 start_codon:yes stop_codon:yes gene_type:complete
MKKIKIICTLGPSSFDKQTLNLLKKEGVDIFRINLSHTNIKEIKKKIYYLKKNKLKNICIDTEGAQIRTTHTNKKYILRKNKYVFIGNDNKNSNDKIINLYPEINLKNLKRNTKIYIGFNNLCLEVTSKNNNVNRVKCKVLAGGYLESKKGVHINTNLILPPLTKKDIFALQIANKLKIKNYAISFVNNPSDIDKVRKIVGKKANIISKIETKNALKNLKGIASKSSALLIDRGDLSRYIPIESIPAAQEYIIKFSKKMKKPTYVATNLLETMIKENLPTRAESHDIYATLHQGAQGLVLAAETAIGKSPINCVKFLKRCININKKKIFLNEKF